jgi:hypothetical protein
MLKVCRFAVILASVCFIAACDGNKETLSIANNAPMPEFVTQADDQFLLTHGNLTMNLQPMAGGRIASLKYKSHEILLPKGSGDSVLWGSVLWSSPQKDWNWPPVAVLDSKPYQVEIEKDGLVFTSAVDEKTGYQFVKRFTVIPDREAFLLGYSIYNRTAEAKSVAPWEVTRVPPAGVTFFPKGHGNIESGIFYPFAVELLDDIVWFNYDLKKLQQDHHKLLCDGSEGWLAYVNNGYLFVKQFEDIPVEQIAAGEAEIELFANAEKTYLELEQQGRIVTLEPGEHLDWEVIWHVRKLPKGMSEDPGSKELVNYVREIVKESAHELSKAPL